MCGLCGGTKDENREKKIKKMGRLREWPKSLLHSISQRGQTPSPQTPSPQDASQKSSASKNEAAARNALIAGAIGAGMSVIETGGLNSKGVGLSVAERAVHAASNAAIFAGAAGTFTAAEGSVLTRALKGAGVGLLAGASVNKVGSLSGADPIPKILSHWKNKANPNPNFGERARPFV
jgi:hypothetical protein